MSIETAVAGLLDKQAITEVLHRRPGKDGLVDDYLKCRYIDRFERRDGQWKIAHRMVFYDWA